MDISAYIHQLINKTPSARHVVDAIEPQRAAAIQKAEKAANELIDRRLKVLADHDWDVNAAAPRPKGTESRATYKQMMAAHNALLSFTADDERRNPRSRSFRAPNYRVRSQKAVDRFLEMTRQSTNDQYDSFIGKMVEKIGPVASAELSGSHVWGYSFLKVTKEDGSTEVWKTQQITNVSSLGTIFNQWPTRRLK